MMIVYLLMCVYTTISTSTITLRKEAYANVSLGSGDTYQISMSDIFDVSRSTSVRYSSNNSKVAVSGTFSRFKPRKADLSFIKSITTMHKASETVVAYIYDETKIAYFDTNVPADSPSYTVIRNEDFSTGGACFDAYYNHISFTVVVLCEDQPAPPLLQSGPSKRIFINVLDYKTGEFIAQKMVYLPNGMEIPVGLRAKVIRQSISTEQDIEQQATNTFLIIYSQGNSFRHTEVNLDMVICRNIDGGILDFDCRTTLNLEESNINIKVLHDMYVEGQDIIITGEHASKKIMITKCSFNATRPGIDCPGESKLMDFSHGFVAPLSMDRFVQIDFENETVTVCPTVKKWDALCPVPQQYSIGKDMWVRDVELNRGLLFLTMHDSLHDHYAGYSMYDVGAGHKISMLHGSSALIYDRNILYRTDYQQNTIFTSYVEDDYILLDPANFSGPIMGDKNVLITATDDKQSSVKFELQIEWVSNSAGPSFSHDTVVPELEYLFDSFVRLPINHRDIHGNGLNFTLEFVGLVKPKITPFVIHTGLLDLEFKVKDRKDARRQNFTDFYFGEGYMVGVDVDKQIDFYDCTLPSYKLLACVLKQSKKISVTSRKILEAGKFSEDYYFAVVGDEKEIEIHIYDGDKITSQSFSKKVVGAEGFLSYSLIEKNTYVGTLAIIVEKENKSRHIEFIQHVPSENKIVQALSDITHSSTESGSFCPKLITANSEGWIYVHSGCENDNRIYVFRMPNTASPLYDIPLSPEIDILTVCYYDEHILVQGKTKKKEEYVSYFTGLYNNYQTREYINTRGTGRVDGEYSVQCESGAQLFSLHYSKEGLHSVDVYYARSSGRASKRLHSRISNSTVPVRSFSIYGSLLTAGLTGEGEITAYYSLNDGPYLFAYIDNQPDNQVYSSISTGGSGGLHGEGIFTITDINRKQSQIRFYMRISSQDYSITHRRRENRTFENGKLNLDNVLEIQGPVRSAHIIGGSSDKVRLEERIVQVGLHTPKELPYDIGSYEFIENIGLVNYTVAARQSRGAFSRTLYVDVFIQEEFQYGVEIPISSRVQTLTACLGNKDDEIVLIFVETSVMSMERHAMKAAVVRKGKLVSLSQVDLISAIDIQSYVNGDNLFLFAQDQKGATVYMTKMGDIEKSEFEEVLYLANVTSMGVFRNGSDVVIAACKRGIYKLIFYAIQTEESTTTNLIITEYSIDIPQRYQLTSVICNEYSPSEVVCVCNSDTAYMIEFAITLATFSHTTSLHFKYQFYEIMHIEIAGEFIVAQATTSRPGLRDFELQVWKLARSGGRGNLAYSVPLNGPDFGHNPLNYTVAVSARDRNAEGYEGHVATSGRGPKSPLTFFKVSDFQFEVKDKSFDPNTVRVHLVGSGSVNIAMSDLYVFEKTPADDKQLTKKGLGWFLWTIIILLTIAFLVLIVKGVIFFVNRNGSGEVYDKSSIHEDNYSKISETMMPSVAPHHTILEEDTIPA